MSSVVEKNGLPEWRLCAAEDAGYRMGCAEALEPRYRGERWACFRLPSCHPSCCPCRRSQLTAPIATAAAAASSTSTRGSRNPPRRQAAAIPQRHPHPPHPKDDGNGASDDGCALALGNRGVHHGWPPLCRCLLLLLPLLLLRRGRLLLTLLSSRSAAGQRAPLVPDRGGGRLLQAEGGAPRGCCCAGMRRIPAVHCHTAAPRGAGGCGRQSDHSGSHFSTRSGESRARCNW